MRYRVRTPDGELGYSTLRDIEVAYAQGLVGPEDEVLEEGHTTWRKASSIPTLARARPPAKGLSNRGQLLGVVIAVALGICALVLITSDSSTRRGLGFVLALATGVVLMRVTTKAFKRPGSPGS
jgi:hypothetical protein